MAVVRSPKQIQDMIKVSKEWEKLGLVKVKLDGNILELEFLTDFATVLLSKKGCANYTLMNK